MVHCNISYCWVVWQGLGKLVCCFRQSQSLPAPGVSTASGGTTSCKHILRTDDEENIGKHAFLTMKLIFGVTVLCFFGRFHHFHFLQPIPRIHISEIKPCQLKLHMQLLSSGLGSSSGFGTSTPVDSTTSTGTVSCNRIKTIGKWKPFISR